MAPLGGLPKKTARLPKRKSERKPGRPVSMEYGGAKFVFHNIPGSDHTMVQSEDGLVCSHNRSRLGSSLGLIEQRWQVLLPSNNATLSLVSKNDKEADVLKCIL